MTTLPQTISARPRPTQSVSAVPAVASPVMLPGPLHAQSGQAGLTGADIWRVFRQNMWLFIVACILSGIAGFGLNMYLARYHTYYVANGQVLVQPPPRYDPTGQIRLDEQGNDIDLKMMLQNQVQQLRSPRLMTDILTDANSVTRQSPWMQRVSSDNNGRFDHGEALKALQEAFTARAIEGSSIIDITMKAGTPAEARRILEEIVNRRIAEARESGQRGSGDTVETINELSRQKKLEVQRLETELKNMVASMSADSAGEGTALQFKVMEITKEQQAAQSQIMAARDALTNAQQAMQRGGTLPEVESQVLQDPMLMNQRRMVESLAVEVEVAKGQYGENNERLGQARARLDVMADMLRQREEDARARYSQQYLNALQSAVASAETRFTALQKQIDDLNATLTSVSQLKAEIQSKREELQAARLQLNDLEQRVVILRTTSNQRPHQEVEWAARPVDPTSPAFPRLPMTVAACVLLGLGLAVGLAFLREVMDASVKSPRDVARVGQMNVLGMIPDDSQDPQAGDPLELTIANAPHSMTAEQFRLMRARLGHLAPLETTRTILVTSPQPGDGKTTVACNLAAGMALNGRKILLVDANFRRPAVHEVFDISNERGFSDCLGNLAEFDNLVHESKVPNLFVLPAGPRPDNPAELVEGPAFTEVVDRALEEYDHVIFDSGPILFVSETSALAPQCDGVISVIRARRSTRGLLGRLRDQLRSLNVEHLGVVLNAVRHHAGGYYNRNIKTYYAYQDKLRRR